MYGVYAAVVVKSSYYTDCNVMRKPNRTKQSLIHIIVVMKTPFDLKLFLLKKIIHRTNPNQHRHNYTHKEKVTADHIELKKSTKYNFQMLKLKNYSILKIIKISAKIIITFSF